MNFLNFTRIKFSSNTKFRTGEASMDKTVRNGEQAKKSERIGRSIRATNLKANLADGAALLVAPSLHASPVSILQARGTHHSDDL